MNVLIAAQFPTGTGYAWDTIERVFRGLADRWIASGRSVYVCYPAVGDVPPAFQGSGVQIIPFDYPATAQSPAALWRFGRLLRRLDIGLLYLTDQPTWSFRYPFLYLCGVRTLVVHDRTSGERTRRSGPLLALKRLLHRIPWLSGSRFIGVSRFVARRLIESNGTPPGRTHVVYNGVEVERFVGARPNALTRLLGIPDGSPVVFASGRAQPYKGIPVLIEAAAVLQRGGDRSSHFAYCGDGPGLEEFRHLAADRGLDRFHFLGRRADIPSLLGSATVAVVPSIWAEAFGLTVAESMAAGVPVICSASGGIPELIEDGVTGVLVPAGDAPALAAALRALLDDPARRSAMGAQAQRVARERFALPRVVDDLWRVVEPGPA
jgi:glycosyltransferase involved in cell wall biosynthesis